MSNIIVTGGSSGIGLSIVSALLVDGHRVINLDIEEPFPNVFGQYSKYGHIECDVSDFLSVSAAYSHIKMASLDKSNIDILINNAGINYINWIEETPDENWDAVVGVNAKGIFNTAKVFKGALRTSKGAILNIVSNASHMPMTNSIAYNASKGAAHIMTLQMARELGPQGISVFGISPNRIKGTGMSNYIDSQVCELRGWTKEYARDYQLKALPAGEETDPETLAEFIAFLLSSKQRHKYLAGTVLPYGK